MTSYHKIQALCEKHGIRLSTLAAETGVSSSVFSELKKGRTKKLSEPTLRKVAQYFGVPVGYLLDDGADDLQEELFRKRALLFDLSEKATQAELDTILKLVNALVGYKE